MMWIGGLLGLIVGAVAWGIPGALALGFLGWLAGLIVQSHRSAQAPTESVGTGPNEARVAGLERRIVELEKRIARLEPAAIAVDEHAPIEAPSPLVATMQEAGPAPEAAAVPERPVEPAHVEPPAPAAPNPFVAWLTGGNAIARVGLLILFFGLAFLLKYAAERDLIPVEMRVGGVALVGIAMLIAGWRLRSRRRGYALGFQGAGVAILYLTTFAALRLYALLPPPAAFVLLAGIAIFSAILAVAEDAVILAAFGAGGGFLAPILASTGEGSHVMLFGYYLLLNAGIVVIAFFKAWRPLNVMGLLFTFFIGLAWGMRFYRPQYFDTTEPFLVAFFVLYVAIAVLFTRREAPALRNPMDATIVFGTPLGAFGLQAALVRGTEFALAFSSLAAAAFYVALAFALHRAERPSWRVLVESFLALGIVFATLAIPLALDARWTSAAWALEGAAIVWFGIRQQRSLARAFGMLLELAAGVSYVIAYPRLHAVVPLVDAAFVGAVLLAGAGLWTHRALRAAGERLAAWESVAVPIFFLWGVAWTFFAGHHEIEEFLWRQSLNAHVAFVAATALAFSVLARRWDWSEATWLALALLPALVVLAAMSVVELAHPFALYGWIAWPFALAAQWAVLRVIEGRGAPGVETASHVAAVLLLAVLAALELRWQAGQLAEPHTAWTIAAVAVVPAALVLAVASPRVAALWPVRAHPEAYRVRAPLILAIALLAWTLYANVTHDGRSDPLPYLPLLNAIDLGHGLVAAALAAWWIGVRRDARLTMPVDARTAAIVVGILTFVWLNAILLRTLHHWAAIPYDAISMSRSVLVQASLSVFWSLLALALMLFATRHARRPLWIIGAALMAVVVVKLFVVDLSHVGGIERIVSFIVVGLLMLLIGYLSPVPPRAQGGRR